MAISEQNNNEIYKIIVYLTILGLKTIIFDDISIKND